MSRQSTGKIEQIEGFGFEHIGDCYRGTYESKKVVPITDKTGTRDSPLYRMVPDPGDKPDGTPGGDGKPFGVWASPLLDDLMSQVNPGTYIEIRYIGDRPNKNPKLSALRLFEVETFK